MDSRTKVQLESLRFFRDLSPTQIAIIVQRAEISDYAAGDMIFSEDTPERFIGYILEGSGTYSFEDRSGAPRTMKTHSNAPIGSVYLDGFNQMGTLMAQEQTRIVSWPLDIVEALETEHPALAIHFYKGLTFYLVQNMRRLIGTS